VAAEPTWFSYIMGLLVLMVVLVPFASVALQKGKSIVELCSLGRFYKYGSGKETRPMITIKVLYSVNETI
jgi:hypothetical protein